MFNKENEENARPKSRPANLFLSNVHAISYVYIEVFYKHFFIILRIPSTFPYTLPSVCPPSSIGPTQTRPKCRMR